jgi:hypothetical protein
MKTIIGAGLIALLTAAAPVMANHGVRDAGVNERQTRLEQRMEHGWRAGELTRHELRRLRHEMREIERAEHYFWSDGRLTPRERSELHARLDDFSRRVQHERRDVERRHGSYNYGHHADRRF